MSHRENHNRLTRGKSSPGPETREKKRRTLGADLDEEGGEAKEEEGEAM